MKYLSKQKIKGVYVVEFTLIIGMFLLTIFMVMEIIAYMYLMNTASEVTRRGARLAVVCDIGAAGIVSQMAARYPNLTSQNVMIKYSPDGCNEGNCQTVRVGLKDLSTTIIGVTADVTTITRDFATTLPRESMNSALNPACA